MFRPGFDLDLERQARADAGQPEWFGEDDLYPDVRPALSKLREMGVWVGVVGNQTVRAGGLLRGLDLPTDFIATSDDWGIQKPAPEFFHKVVEAAGCAAAEIVYVGDRIDNDVAPAKRVGMRTAYIQRGPWGGSIAKQKRSRNSPIGEFVTSTSCQGLSALRTRRPSSAAS
ncbi:HAD family hydrolase [Nocardia sp. NPDC050408]|uniref:HAD family hydrolase n=1 Tax=Nocardia sp. NPDC050408 TaxID=3364319 RepID=UPI00379CB903